MAKKYTVTKKDRKKYNVSEAALAQRRNNSALIPARTDEEMDYNARQIQHMIRIQEIAMSADKNDITSLKSCFSNYLRLCQEDGFKISNIAAYASMGMTRDQFDRFKRKDSQEIRELVSMVQSICAVSRETLISDNKLNPVIGIFWQRNFDGLRNDTEQAQAAAEQEENDTDNKSYKSKYMEMIGE